MSDSRSVDGTSAGRRILVELLAMAAIGMALGGLGPFGSYALPLAPRLAFWSGFVLLGYAVFRPMLGLRIVLARAAAIPPIASDLVILTIGAFPLALLIGRGLQMVRPERAVESFGILYIQVWAIGLAIDLLMLRLFEPSRAEPIASPLPVPEPTPAAPAFLARLPPGFGDRLHCLSVEDHYVRAHGDRGSVLLLMRLRDAVAELGEAGMQVHRSWWVSFDSVEGSDRDGRALQLVLANGLRVPVARQYAAAVRERVHGRRRAA